MDAIEYGEQCLLTTCDDVRQTILLTRLSYTFITNINVYEIQTEYCEYHFAQIHVRINKQKKILIS